MSTVLAPMLTPALLARLGREGHDPTLVVPVLSVDAAGFPHVALLSTWEMVATDATSIRLALWGDSGAAANLRRTGQATLLVADEAIVFYLKLRIAPGPAVMAAAPWNAIFDGRVETVLADVADSETEGGSHLSSGIRFVPDPLQAAVREAVRAELAARP